MMIVMQNGAWTVDGVGSRRSHSPLDEQLRHRLVGAHGDSAMAEVRIFSYLPNPRVWKAVIAARIGGVDLEVRGAAGGELVDWLWDFDARPLSEVSPEERAAAERMGRIGFKGRKLYKTDAFFAAQPFGTVSAGFSGDGQAGIFESNSIMRAVARQAERSGLWPRSIRGLAD
jgi:elongation factor 1-gamma